MVRKFVLGFARSVRGGEALAKAHRCTLWVEVAGTC